MPRTNEAPAAGDPDESRRYAALNLAVKASSEDTNSSIIIIKAENFEQYLRKGRHG